MQKYWDSRPCLGKQLSTVSGRSLRITNHGTFNLNSGPDFLNAVIELDGQTWMGNIELHLRSSDWLKHGHQHNQAFNSVILHVVFLHDAEVDLPNGSKLEVLLLEGGGSEELRDFSILSGSVKHPLACGRQLALVPRKILEDELEVQFRSRIMKRKFELDELLTANKGDVMEAFFIFLASFMGFGVNRHEFSFLARRLPFRELLKVADNPVQTEAIIFGMAGMLNGTFQDDYPRVLQNEFRFLSVKLGIRELPLHWHYSKLRPQNFPGMRLAQLAALVPRIGDICDALIMGVPLAGLVELLRVKPSIYWEDHYRFDVTAAKVKCIPGIQAAENLCFNALFPFLNALGEHLANVDYCRRAVDGIRLLGPEQNGTVRYFSEAGKSPLSAYESQAMMELYDNNCRQKKCLDCRIGRQILER